MPQLRHRPRDLIQNRYEIRKLLGSGAFGTVYGCRDAELDVPVAVKELHVLDDREAALSQFRAEAIHLSKLRHPNIVSGHYEPHAGKWRVCPVCGLDFPQLGHCPDHNAALIGVDSRHYLVMEYLVGPDLLRLCELRGGVLSVEETLDWARPIASALALVHGKGFVHRDIKPENIQLRAEADAGQNEAVLLDFGIATQGETPDGDRYGTRANRQTQGGGTVGYAPENLAERRAPDARSDIHAFGMTLYHLLCGLDPTEPGPLGKMRSHTPRDFAPEIPRWLDDLVVACIAFEAEKRPQNGAILLELLNGENQTEISAPTPDLGSTTARLSPAPTATPLNFRSGHLVRNLAELAWAGDKFPEECAKKLYAGEIERWLNAVGEGELARRAGQIRAQFPSRAAGLETFLEATGLLAKPQLELSAQSLDFGSLGPQKKKSLDVRIWNRGRGHLFGRVRNSGGPLAVPGAFEGNKAAISVVFDAFRLAPGRYDGEIELDSSGGRAVVAWTARVRGLSAWPAFWAVALNGIYGALWAGALRSVPFDFQGVQKPGFGWFDAPADFNNLGWTGALFGVGLALGIGVWALTYAIFCRSCGVLALLGAVGICAGFASLVFGSQWITAIDLALKPLFEPYVGNFAAAAWMFAGGALGAIMGAILRVRDLFSSRVWAIGLGFVATFVAIFGFWKGLSGG